MDDNRLENEVSRGREAEGILSNRLVVAAHDEIERAIVEALASCPIRDREGAHELLLKLKANREHRQLFTRYVETGKMASLQLGKMQRVMDKVSARFR